MPLRLKSTDVAVAHGFEGGSWRHMTPISVKGMEASPTLIERSHEPFFIGSPSFGDEQRSSRSDNWRGESERRSSATFSECRRAARRLYADRVDHFRRDRFPD